MRFLFHGRARAPGDAKGTRRDYDEEAMRRRWVLEVSVVLAASACAPASAPPAAVVEVRPVATVAPISEADAGPRPLTLPPIETADRLAAEGRAYAARAEYAAALNRFEAAYRISPSD